MVVAKLREFMATPILQYHCLKIRSSIMVMPLHHGTPQQMAPVQAIQTHILSLLQLRYMHSGQQHIILFITGMVLQAQPI